eukprot:1156134-Pelagomonas_calceolata.AAC.1
MTLGKPAVPCGPGSALAILRSITLVHMPQAWCGKIAVQTDQACGQPAGSRMWIEQGLRACPCSFVRHHKSTGTTGKV